jgi:hypothetical protein
MKKITNMCIVILLVCSSCIDKVYTTDPLPKLTLPDFTTEGKNTIGCIIDGEVWVPGGVIPGKNTLLSGGAGLIPFDVSLKRYKKHQNYTQLATFYVGSLMSYTNVYRVFNFSIEGNDFPKIGKLSITKIYYSSNGNGYYDYIDKLNPPTVDFVKFDTLSKIASGRFNGIIYRDSTKSKPIKISEGIFDVKFYIL